MTFQELYDQFLIFKRIEVRPGTLGLYLQNWKYLGPKLCEREVSTFGQADARFLLATMIDEGLHPKTAKDRMSFVKQMILFAARELEQTVKPTDWKLKYPASRPREIKNFTEAEMLRIVKGVCAEIDNGETFCLPVLIALLTGMRIGEVAGLRWGDIDFVHNLVKVERNVTRALDPATGKERFFVGSPKTSSGYREIPVLPLLRRVLRQTGGKSPNSEDYICGTIDNKKQPRTAHSIRDSYERFLKRHKLPKINFHGLRHTYATLLVESGGDIKTISTLLGHSTVALTLNLYVHPSLESKRKVTNRAFRKLKELS